MIPIYIGYDPREKEAFCVLMYSILKYASRPVSIIPLKKELFNSFYYRERHPLQSTEFSFTRFLVPYLQHYNGWAIYMDCDMLCQDDIVKLWDLKDAECSVMVVPHDYKPVNDIKFLNQVQSRYHRKNWSSMVLFNCSKCTVLTPEIVQNIDGLFLHQFIWADDKDIGFIPDNWNHLVGNGKYIGDGPLGLIHYTTGGPWFKESMTCPYASNWFHMRDELHTHTEVLKHA